MKKKLSKIEQVGFDIIFIVMVSEMNEKYEKRIVNFIFEVEIESNFVDDWKTK